MKTYNEFITEAESITNSYFNKEAKKLKKTYGEVKIEIQGKNVNMVAGDQALVLYTGPDQEFREAQKKKFTVWLNKAVK